LFAVAAPGARRQEKGRVAMPKILCVEDNQDNLFMLQRRLTRAGFDVTISTDGAQSVEWAKTLLPDLIVMDLNLPKVDGWEATRRLKNQPETKHIPIIVLTADSTQKSRADALAAGCDEFELKPIDFQGLVGKIQSLLSASAKP
jgi:CheY-like chemotaxis protein